MSIHTHEWLYMQGQPRSAAFICNVAGCGAHCEAVPSVMPKIDGNVILIDSDVVFDAAKDAPGRYGIVVIDPESPASEVWAEPFDSEDSAPDPDEPEMRAALFATRAEAEVGLARRIRCEVRPLPPKRDAANVSVGRIEAGKPCPLCREIVDSIDGHRCPWMPTREASREAQEQAMSFAWGKLAASTRHRPSREAFERLTRDRYGWALADFEAWWRKHEAGR